MRADKDIKQLDSGKWSYAGMEFSSEEAAKLFANRGAADEPEFDAKKPRPWLFAATALLFVCGGYWLFSGTNKAASSGYAMPSPAGRNIAEMDGLFLCQQAIKRASLDAENTSAPYVKNQGTGSEYYFAWNNETKLVRSRNGLGLEVGVTASCIVDAASGRIRSLTIQGRSLV